MQTQPWEAQSPERSGHADDLVSSDPGTQVKIDYNYLSADKASSVAFAFRVRFTAVALSVTAGRIP